MVHGEVAQVGVDRPVEPGAAHVVVLAAAERAEELGQLPERRLRHDPARLGDRVAEPPMEVDHQALARSRRGLGQLPAVVERQRRRLRDEHVVAGLERLDHQLPGAAPGFIHTMTASRSSSSHIRRWSVYQRPLPPNLPGRVCAPSPRRCRRPRAGRSAPGAAPGRSPTSRRSPAPMNPTRNGSTRPTPRRPRATTAMSQLPRGAASRRDSRSRRSALPRTRVPQRTGRHGKPASPSPSDGVADLRRPAVFDVDLVDEVRPEARLPSPPPRAPTGTGSGCRA